MIDSAVEDGSVRPTVVFFDGPSEHQRVYVLRVLFNFCFLVVNRRTRAAIAVDPAWDAPLIERTLSQERAKLVGVFVTHSHLDHFNLADSLSQQHDCPVYMSSDEVGFYRVEARNMNCVRSGQMIELAGISIIPLMTPGHTRGSVCFWVGGSIFTGDTLFAEGCGMCVGPGADAGMMYHSLAMLRSTVPEEARVFPGHSYGKAPGEKFGALLSTNIYLQFNELRPFVDFRMRKGQRSLFRFK